MIIKEIINTLHFKRCFFYTFSFPELVLSFTNPIGNVRKAVLDADHVDFHTCG